MAVSTSSLLGRLLLAAGLLTAGLARAQAPANDNCAGALALPVASLGNACSVVTANNTTATGSPEANPDCAVFYSYNDVWYTVAVPASGRIQLATSQLDPDVQSVGLVLYTGTCGSLTALQCVEGYTSSSSGYYPTVDVANRTPGEMLYVRAFTYSRNAPRAGTFGLCASEIAPCPAPANLTAAEVHPNRATLTYDPTSGANGYTVRYTAAGGSTLVATPSGNPTDTYIELKNLLPGTVYTAQVAADCGGYSAPITFTTSPALANDDCAGAIALAVGTVCTAPARVATADATATAGVADPGCGNYQGGDLWYTLTVPANGIVQVETSDVDGISPFQTGLQLYSGSCGSLSPLSCDVNHGQQSFSYIRLSGRTPGEVLYLRAWTDYGPDSRAFSLCATTDDASPLTTWTGTTSTDWATASNWTNGVPDASKSALVPNVPSGRYPVLPAGTSSVHTLNIDRYAGFTATSGTLVVTGNLLCREYYGAQFTAEDNSSWFGTLYPDGVKVRLAGTGPQQLGGISHLYDVEVQAGGTITLSSYLEINHTLTMSGGILHTGLTWINLTRDSNIEFFPNTARLVHESETSYVLGHIEVGTEVVSGTRNDFNGLGLTILSAGTDEPGYTRLVRYTGRALAGVGGSGSIQRQYLASPDNDAGLDLTLDLHYFAHERNGLADADLRPYSSPISGGNNFFGDVPTITGPWVLEGPSTRLAPAAADSASTIRLTGLTHLSAWSLGSAAAPLPVSLVSFTAEANGPDAVLRWATASEVNNKYFEVEVSTDGVAFVPVGRVAGHGTTPLPQAYTLRDAGVARYAAPLLYYRLRQVDTNGAGSYSPVRTVAGAGLAEAGVVAFPNPFTHALTVQVPAATTGPVLLTLHDALGRECLRQTATLAEAGTRALVLDTAAALPAGLYYLTVKAAGYTAQLKVSRE